MIGAGTNIAGRYSIERRIGRGGFASVYLAQDSVLQRNVAVKVIVPEEVSEDDDAASSLDNSELGARLLELLSEARFVARHHHPNILDVYDFGQLGDEAYIVMPYATGGTLLQKLKTARRFSLEQAGRYLDQMAAGLDYAHNLGVIHRDIKPQNVFMFDHDQLVIGDFGLAKVLSDTEAFSNTRASGTPSYMAPEQFSGRISRASDIYSLGVVVYQMLTGQLPFTAPSQAEMMFAHINNSPPPLSRFLPDAPPALEMLLMRVLAKKPQERPASAGEFARLYQLALANPEAELPLITRPLALKETLLSSPRPDLNIHELSTRSPELASSTQISPSSESGPLFVAPVRRKVSRRTKTPSWWQLGAVGAGVIALIVVAIALVLANLGGPKSSPTVVAITLLNPTSTPKVIIQEITSTPAAGATQTAAAIPTATLPATPTVTATPEISATPTLTASPTETPPPPTPTATAPAQQQPNPGNPGGGQPLVQPQSQPTIMPTVTPTPVSPTATSAPVVPTFTPTPTPCPIGTRRGFGLVYSSRNDVAQKLGCAKEDERQATLAYQAFSGGIMVYTRPPIKFMSFLEQQATGRGNALTIPSASAIQPQPLLLRAVVSPRLTASISCGRITAIYITAWAVRFKPKTAAPRPPPSYLPEAGCTFIPPPATVSAFTLSITMALIWIYPIAL